MVLFYTRLSSLLTTVGGAVAFGSTNIQKPDVGAKKNETLSWRLKESWTCPSVSDSWIERASKQDEISRSLCSRSTHTWCPECRSLMSATCSITTQSAQTTGTLMRQDETSADPAKQSLTLKTPLPVVKIISVLRSLPLIGEPEPHGSVTFSLLQKIREKNQNRSPYFS